MLVERDGCVFDAEQLRVSHGFADLDATAREAFVNHIHISGPQLSRESTRIIDCWCSQLRTGWPGCIFRIYRETGPNEVTLRFHRVRTSLPNWAEEGVEIIEVRT